MEFLFRRSRTFEDIEELAAQCKFTNCRHESESLADCRIRDAIAQNFLSDSRRRSYQKLEREARRSREKEVAASVTAQRKMRKSGQKGQKGRRGRDIYSSEFGEE